MENITVVCTNCDKIYVVEDMRKHPAYDKEAKPFCSNKCREEYHINQLNK